MAQMRVTWKFPQLLLAAALVLGVTACGSSAPKKPASSPTAPAASGNAATEKLVAADWVAFFNAKTPVPERISLLQDGPVFAPIIRAQAGAGLALLASATVSKVTLVSSTQASVKYSILVSGTPALTGQTGTSVYQAGKWKVGIASFCGLLTLENGGKTSKLPAACKTAG
jgi:hypothetical protein